MKQQKLVMRVEMNDAKKRTKAMRIVFGVAGVESAGFQGVNQIVVKGKGIDSVSLITLIRKSVGHTELITQTNIHGGLETDDDDDDEEEETKRRSVLKHLPIVHYPYNNYYGAVPVAQQYPYEYCVRRDYDSCNIM